LRSGLRGTGLLARICNPAERFVSAEALTEENHQLTSETGTAMRHTISVLLQNKPGVLSRVTGLFSGRGFNIDSLSVAETLEKDVSCLTLVTHGDEAIIEQITKQLHKLIDVIKVTDMAEHDHVEREMVLIRVKAEAGTRAEVLRVIDIFRGKVVDVSPKSYVIELTGSKSKVQAVIDILRPLGIQEIMRSGVNAITRGKKF
jgi:acetolactate synthase I/III small subunit